MGSPSPQQATAPSWQDEYRTSLRTAQDLVEFGLLSAGQAAQLEPVLRRYRFWLPRYYASLIERGNPSCPVRLQAIPSEEEVHDAAGFLPDPLADLAHRPAPRITHRYPNRVLLHLTSNCSMYCRYCFRKSLLNEKRGEFFSGELAEALEYVTTHGEIEEVIFSGGDPLMVPDARLADVLQRLGRVGHLKRVRFHSRVPVTFPSRVTEELAGTLGGAAQPVVLVTHFNHPREITPQSRRACARLSGAGIRLLNQSVLLRRVNDRTDTLKALCEGLFEMGVLPYYLHHPDRAAGTAHFDVSLEAGRRLYHELRSRLPGYLVPRYVMEDVGHPYKRDVVAAEAAPEIPERE